MEDGGGEGIGFGRGSGRAGAARPGAAMLVSVAAGAEKTLGAWDGGTGRGGGGRINY